MLIKVFLFFLFHNGISETNFVSYDSLINNIKVDKLKIVRDSIKSRMEYINSTTPFQIDYTAPLEKSIIKHLEKRQATYLELYSRSRYFFPIFENALQKYNVPLELKYLPIVESSLNPKAKSRVGATGLWQFMFNTAKELDLEVNSYVDERMDPIKSSDAAARYLSELYARFNDWNLAIAAYNYGPGNMKRAMKASGYSNFWNLTGYLPKETANYVPSFLSTLYLFEFAKEHEIKINTSKSIISPTDSIPIKEMISFSHISAKINIPMETLIFLNPSYIHNIIPWVKNKQYYLTLPQNYTDIFIEKEAEIYKFAKLEFNSREKPLPQLYELNSRIIYRVVNGDFLGKIGKSFGVKVSDIKTWNKLKDDRLKIGQRLIIFPKKFPKKQ
ncbi:transglycosylase SLT domain-containing protein [Flavobacteriaceae bacterium]|nr:transglycosylase SLT domain-containing protein [Flavobacteriaceae bacterium]MDC1492209.1 transglycosylase SLT domain-containing protein [Flavobacteriaceae bacterium]